jgi:hypothetical protein
MLEFYINLTYIFFGSLPDDQIFYYMISDNVFSDWLTSLVMFFEKMLYSPRVTSSTKLNQRKRRDKSLF